MTDEFYIGWETKATFGIGKAARKVSIMLLVLALLAPVVLAMSQRMIGASVFEWGTHKTFSGILQTQPYPHLLVPRPGQAGSASSFSSYYLVAPWKHWGAFAARWQSRYTEGNANLSRKSDHGGNEARLDSSE